MTHPSSPPNASPFTGSIPQHYDHYLGPMYFEPYAIDIVERFNPFSMQIVLELGCGTGRVTRHLRQVLPAGATLISSDVSPDMLAMAKEKLKGLDIDWRIINAQELPFEDNSIDLVICCFAYMFVENKYKAFAEARRVLKPGGMFLFSTWDKLERNEPSYVFRKIVKTYLTESLPEIYNVPYAFYDPSMIREILVQAGFSSITIETVKKMAVSVTAKEAAIGLSHGGSLYNEIMNRNPAWIEEITATLEIELGEKYGKSPMSAPVSAVVCQAFAPKSPKGDFHQILL